MDLTQEEYDEDPRTPCKYGINCYQKNPIHKSKYKHPPRKAPTSNGATQSPVKKFKIDNGETSHSSLKKDEEDVSQNMDDTESVTNEPALPKPKLLSNIDPGDFIKSKFLVDMPKDFYNFWNFCKKLNSTDPSMALKEVGLILVGPFDVLAGKFENTSEKDIDKYVLHWRYFYDPPEFQTLIMRDDKSGYHLGYFRDSPEEMPVFLAYNFANKDGMFTVVGDNLFAGVSSFLEFLQKSANPFMKTVVAKYSNLVRTEADMLKLSLSRKSSKITARNNKTLARTFNQLGFIVPYDKRTQVGYRTLSISNKELQVLLDKLGKASGDAKDKLMSQLQEVLTNTNIAIDECDFGTGIELGLDILCSGIETLSSVLARLLASCYRLVNKEAFAVIIESHMKNRRKGFDLSVL